MTQTLIEFLNTASRLVPDFDGRSENLRAFLDSLTLVESIKGNHESTAVSLIKTKLKGNARNLIDNENTISDIIQKIRNTVKGESVDVLSAKIMNIKQGGKTANTYCSEVENLTKSLENAYISDGLSTEIAGKYSLQGAVKALTKNCSIDKVKLIMEAGQFNSMNEAISKFVNSCTEATGQQNTILHFRNRYNRNNYRRDNTQFHRRYNQQRRNNNNNNVNNRPQRRPSYSYGNGNQRGNRNYVRVTEYNNDDSENSETPLR